jgi:hypothetical protein
MIKKRAKVVFGIPRRRIWLVLLAMLFSLGCGQGPRGDISGKVTYRGKPLPLASSVTFLNVENNQVGSSMISAEGTYSMANVPAGPVRITVVTPPPLKGAGRRKGRKKGAPPPPPPMVVPVKYGDPNQSGLTYTVEPGKQEFDIDLK